MKLLQKLDPRTKIVLVMVISTLSILMNEVLWLAGLLAAAYLMLFLGGMKPGEVFPRLKRFLFLFVALLVIQSIFSPSGAPLITVGEIHLVTTGGVLKGIAVILRMLIIVTSAMMLLTSSPMELVLALIRFGVPYEIAFMVLMAIRFLPVLGEEVRDALTAIQLRGVKIKEIPLGQKIKVYTYIFMPVTASALLKAKKTAIAMEARAFRAFPRRSYLDELHLRGRDYAVMALALAAGLGCCSAYFLVR
ncbi:MAG: energy-coupling factor transporter transmembrane protein EcfT [Firmicutes bacterium]|jgi:energy-coupling factor transport system permease protein|nr:energy-coupling factor transporter transmembrane protein EcfT [Bacillota bacterium]